MARFSVACKINASGSVDAGHVSDVVNSVGTATVAADVATLVADGASPTQAHVTTLNTDWTAFLAGQGAVPATHDVVLSFDAAAVVSKSQLKLAVLELLRIIDGSNDLTP